MNNNNSYLGSLKKNRYAVRTWSDIYHMLMWIKDASKFRVNPDAHDTLRRFLYYIWKTN